MDGKSTPQNIQDAFLNTLRRERDAVTIYLINGAKLSGRIKSFDKFSLLLETGAQEQLIFKHAVSTILHTRRTSAGGDFRAPTLQTSAANETPAVPDSATPKP